MKPGVAPPVLQESLCLPPSQSERVRPLSRESSTASAKRLAGRLELHVQANSEDLAAVKRDSFSMLTYRDLDVPCNCIT